MGVTVTQINAPSSDKKKRCISQLSNYRKSIATHFKQLSLQSHNTHKHMKTYITWSKFYICRPPISVPTSCTKLCRMLVSCPTHSFVHTCLTPCQSACKFTIKWSHLYSYTTPPDTFQLTSCIMSAANHMKLIIQSLFSKY